MHSVAGTVVRLMSGSGNPAPWYAIDLVDFEMVPAPLRRPAGSGDRSGFRPGTFATADGLNLHRGISNVIVEDSFFRNNGDDGICFVG
jgi:hypothetical protein